METISEQKFLAEISAIQTDLIGLEGLVESMVRASVQPGDRDSFMTDAVYGASVYLRGVLDRLEKAVLSAPRTKEG